MGDVATIPNTRTRQEWAAVINADWRKSIESIFQTGRDLSAAKAELPNHEFVEMCKNDLAFGPEMSRGLMNIATHDALPELASSGKLPPTWTALLELTKISPEDLRDASERGLLGPDLKVKPARAIAGAYSKPKGSVVKSSDNMLPSPVEARKIARETGRLVAASDGNTYSGASAEEGEDYSRRRTDAFRTLEAITRLAEISDAKQFVSSIEQHWLHDFRLSAIDDAGNFLADFKNAMGVVDAQ